MTDGRHVVSTKLSVWLCDEEAEDDSGDGDRAGADDGKNMIALDKKMQHRKGDSVLSDLHSLQRRHTANAAYLTAHIDSTLEVEVSEWYTQNSGRAETTTVERCDLRK